MSPDTDINILYQQSRLLKNKRLVNPFLEKSNPYICININNQKQTP